MCKTLSFLLLITLAAAKCDLEQEDKDMHFLTVNDDTEGAHEPTTLKIRVTKYNLADAAGQLADNSGIENAAKDFGLDKIFSYAATLPNNEITKGGITHALLPLKLFQFQYQNQNYQVTDTQIEDGALRASVTFEILPTQANTPVYAPID